MLPHYCFSAEVTKIMGYQKDNYRNVTSFLVLFAISLLYFLNILFFLEIYQLPTCSYDSKSIVTAIHPVKYIFNPEGLRCVLSSNGSNTLQLHSALSQLLYSIWFLQTENWSVSTILNVLFFKEKRQHGRIHGVILLYALTCIENDIWQRIKSVKVKHVGTH